VTGFIPLLEPPADHEGETLWFHVRGVEVLVADEPVVGRGTPQFLGLLAGRACWGVDVDDHADAAPGFAPLMRLYGAIPDDQWTVAGRAVQLVEWERTHRFCGRCGTATEVAPGERAKRCPSCGLLAYPRLAPAVITLVERGDEVLLARGRQFPMAMYSCLAGFVEPGETLEEAVRREVREEVGIELAEARYVASQPWPFPHSLMIGFTATWAGGEIVCDPTEIADAGWYRVDALPMIPPRMSIARSLIDAWIGRH